jgi:hypothetical protein
MLSEVVNALLFTFLATEYGLLSQESPPPRNKSIWTFLLHRRNLLLIVVAVLVNLFDRITGALDFTRSLFKSLLHVPTILIAAVAYLVALYYDCRRITRVSFQTFIKQVAWAFLYVLPVYPFLAVLFSFGFLAVIVVWDFLHLPEELLNWPIYYGTLYGPFSFVYWRVKQQVVAEKTSLPSFASGRALGRE